MRSADAVSMSYSYFNTKFTILAVFEISCFSKISFECHLNDLFKSNAKHRCHLTARDSSQWQESNPNPLNGAMHIH